MYAVPDDEEADVHTPSPSPGRRRPAEKLARSGRHYVPSIWQGRVSNDLITPLAGLLRATQETHALLNEEADRHTENAFGDSPWYSPTESSLLFERRLSNRARYTYEPRTEDRSGSSSSEPEEWRLYGHSDGEPLLPISPLPKRHKGGRSSAAAEEILEN